MASKNLGDVYLERENTVGHWRALGTLSATLVLLGFLVFPASFPTAAEPASNQTVLSVVAVVLLALGYSLSVALWFLCRSWLFQFDVLFTPCLFSCLMGAANVVINLALHPAAVSGWSPAPVSALVLSGASSLIYAILCIYTHNKIHQARWRGGPAPLGAERDSASDHATLTDPEDLQRSAWARLLAPSPLGHQRDRSTGAVHTYHIDIPDRAALGAKGDPDPVRALRLSARSSVTTLSVTPEMAAAGTNAALPTLPVLQLSPAAAALQEARIRTQQRSRSIEQSHPSLGSAVRGSPLSTDDFQSSPFSTGGIPANPFSPELTSPPSLSSHSSKREHNHAALYRSNSGSEQYEVVTVPNFTVDLGGTRRPSHVSRAPEELEARMAQPRDSLAGY